MRRGFLKSFFLQNISVRLFLLFLKKKASHIDFCFFDGKTSGQIVVVEKRTKCEIEHEEKIRKIDWRWFRKIKVRIPTLSSGTSQPTGIIGPSS